jgi:hypothetical protein
MNEVKEIRKWIEEGRRKRRNSWYSHLKENQKSRDLNF